MTVSTKLYSRIRDLNEKGHSDNRIPVSSWTKGLRSAVPFPKNWSQEELNDPEKGRQVAPLSLDSLAGLCRNHGT